MQTHKNLEVWHLGIELVKYVYKITETFPGTEKYGLVSQLQRAAVSVPTNIAEGAARNSEKDYLRFLYISLGSLSELDTLIIISRELNMLEKDDQLDELMDKSQKKLMKLIKYLKSKLEVQGLG